MCPSKEDMMFRKFLNYRFQRCAEEGLVAHAKEYLDIIMNFDNIVLGISYTEEQKEEFFEKNMKKALTF